MRRLASKVACCSTHAWMMPHSRTPTFFDGPANLDTPKAMDRRFECADEHYGHPEDTERGNAPAAPAPAAEPATTPPTLPASNRAPEVSSNDPVARVRRALASASGQEDGSAEEAFAAAVQATTLGDRQGHWLSGRFSLSSYGIEMSRDQALARSDEDAYISGGRIVFSIAGTQVTGRATGAS